MGLKASQYLEIATVGHRALEHYTRVIYSGVREGTIISAGSHADLQLMSVSRHPAQTCAVLIVGIQTPLVIICCVKRMAECLSKGWSTSSNTYLGIE